MHILEVKANKEALGSKAMGKANKVLDNKGNKEDETSGADAEAKDAEDAKEKAEA